MADQTPNQPQPLPSSFFTVVFEAPGSVSFQANMDGVTPLQLLALAAWIELKAKNELIKIENQRAQEEAQKAIARPSLVLPGSQR